MKKLFSLLTLALLTMSAWAANSYVKVTATSDLTSGDYLIVCETAGVAFNGGLSSLDVTSNTIAVTISNGEIAADATTNAAIFTYDSEAKSLKSASGLYIGRTANSNGISTSATEAITNEISFDNDGNATIASGGRNLRFNNANDQKRFRYFSSAQTAVQLYKLSGTTPVVTVAAPTLPAACTFTDTYTVNITNNEAGADLYYSTDGLAWTPGNSVTINETTTVYAKATKDGIDSQVVSATYTKVSGANTYVKVTKDSQIAAGNKYIVVCESKEAFMGAIGTYGASYTNNALHITDGIADIAGHGDIVELTLGGATNAWTFATGDNYIYWDNTTTNTLKTTTDNTIDGAKWIISSTNSGYVLVNVDNNERVLRYNASSPRFACYTSTQTPAVLYVQDDNPTPVVPETNEVANLLAANALENGIEFTFTGSATVTYQNGLYMFVKDASGYGLIYGSVGGTFANGDVLNTGWKAIKAVYHGNNQFGSPSNVTASGTNTPVAPEVVTSLTTDKLNAYVKIEHVASIDPTNLKAILVNGDTINLYNRFNVTIPEFENADCSMTGIVNVFDGTMQFYFISSDYEAPVVVVAEPNDLAEANALAENTQFTYANDVAATYQNGDYLFIRDEAGNSGLIYGDVDATFETGDVLGADWSATKKTYYGVPEFTNPADVTNSGDKWEVAPYERQTLTTDDVNTYVIMKGLSIFAETDNTVSHYDQYYYTGADSLVLFNKFNINFTLEEGKTYDVIGIATIYNNAPQLYIISVTECEGTTPIEPEAEAGDYVKVTNTADLTSGEYLIVYEAGSLAFDGGLETLDAVGNSIAVEIVENLIKGGDAVDAAAFTYDAEAGTLKSASGYYIGRTSDSNGMQSNTEIQYTNAITINANGDADIVAEGGAYLRYNSTSDQVRFRYFRSNSYTNQKAIQLYKKVEGETTVVRGDVDGIGGVNMDDLTALINYLLTGNESLINKPNAAICDSLDSTEVNMDDLTALINYLLTGNWPN